MKQTSNLKQCLRRSFFVSAMIGILLAVQSVHADTITLTSYADHGPGTLRQALADAHDGDTILTPSGGTIDLFEQLVVDKSITISGGPSATNFWLIGNGGRIFYIGVGKTVTISGVNMTNGFTDDVGGGAIYNDHSTLTVSNCTISGNSAWTANGGGIYNDGSEGSATLTINNSELHGNQAYLGKGGCIYNDGSVGSATVTVINSTVSYNSAGSSGGGIANSALDAVGSATVTITNSTLTSNSATRAGGGIDNKGDGHGSATLTINNSTVSGNSASGGGGVSNTGVSGGIATLTVTNSTLSGNSANSGGGIYNETPFGAATLRIAGSILNSGASGENIFSDVGTVISDGYNLSNDDGGGLLTGPGDQVNTDPMLGPLQDNGGPTFTHELLSGSPAIDAGDPSFAPPPDYDQRGSGFPRVVNGRIDIGAFEVQTVTPSYAAQIQSPINADGTSTFSVRRGVVPVKFNLTQGGVATCELPPATIAVTRTAGGVIGQVNESVYSGSADTGSNFRIDSCQYVYNLNAHALGVGTYRVDILIDGQVVGSAVFALQ